MNAKILSQASLNFPLVSGFIPERQENFVIYVNQQPNQSNPSPTFTATNNHFPITGLCSQTFASYYLQVLPLLSSLSQCTDAQFLEGTMWYFKTWL